MPVQVIEALPSVSVIPQAEPEQRKKNVIGYARVSTTEQESSYESQLTYFEDLIRRNPDWNFCGMYSDESSGTSTKKRDGFNKMIQACEAGDVDIIVCKSLSRFSRNVVDAISQIRRLRELGVNLWLQKENVWTMEESGEILLVVLSSLAQAESQSISVNVMLGLRYKMQRGIPMINCNHFLGYDKDPASGKLVINPAEAATVRYIFRAFLEGFTPHEIAKKLREAGVPSGAGKSIWPVDSIRYILQNEKYVGDLLMQKTYCKSFLTHKMVKNDGKLPQYFVQDNHDPVVPREVFNLAQAELVRRGKETGHPGQRRYALSGKVICACCGTAYKRFAGARLLPAAQPSVSTDHSPADAPTEATTLPDALPVTPSQDEQGSVENRGVETSSAAVWKCMARCSKKDAAKAYSTLFPDRVIEDGDEHSEGQGGDGAAEGAAQGDAAGAAGSAPEPAAYRDGLTWRCDNKIVDEQSLQMAVDRALSLLPREEANIRLIRDECVKILAANPSPVGGGTPSTARSASPSPGCGEHAGEHSGEHAGEHSDAHSGLESGSGSAGGDKLAAAQILLLHTETALAYLAGSPQPAGSGRADALPCTTYAQFVERARPVLADTAGDADAIDLLIDKVLIDGEKIRVVFKAGVEV